MQKIAKIEYHRGQEIGVGQGMHSRVYLIDEPQLGGQMVVKEIEKCGFTNNANFWDEARAMFASDHDHVVSVQYACETNDHICLIMPYYKRGSLADRIKSDPIPPLEAIRVGQGILSGLTQIHVVGYVHFDVKPSNVLFRDSDQPMVADFGQSQPVGPHGITVPGDVYVAAYPPELLLYYVGSAQSDVYQAGLALYRAVNGDPFYKAQAPTALTNITQSIIDGKFPDRDSFMPHVPKGLRTAIRKALQVDLARRYASASEFAEALGRVEVNHNWFTSTTAGDEMEWRSSKPPRPDLVVRLKRDGTRWSVTMHQERPNLCRACHKIFWKDGLTRPQAFKHLKGVFDALE